MKLIIKGIELILCAILVTILMSIALVKLSTGETISNNDTNKSQSQNANLVPFDLQDQDIIHNSNEKNNNSNQSNNPIPTTNSKLVQDAKIKSNSAINNMPDDRKAILERAKAMVEVKWKPKYNLMSKYGPYIFFKGKTYTGIPYSMDFYQVRGVSDFMSKINDSKKIYGNDCSGFVSDAWGLSRQTTLSFYEAVKKQNKIDGKAIVEISWEDLKPGDAILLDNGKGKGHIMLYISTDGKDNDKMKVYEQNVPTIIPFEPQPLAREDIRSKATLKKEGYFPIRLKNVG